MDKSIKDYFSSIGEKGGRLSRRKLEPEISRNMLKVREARRAYREYYAQCFWSYKPDLKISLNDVAWVGFQIMKHGGREAWIKGTKLCR